jgi:methylated-DNA-[protein]-cysteine S-methyltransferase
MTETFFTLFETAMGTGGLAWSAAGVIAVAFPGPEPAKTRAHLLARAAEAVETAPPADIARVVDDIVALFAGEARNLSYAPLDMGAVPDFDRGVLALTLKIKPGETKTYGDLAAALGDISLSRRVGQALGRNPFPVIVPCHRVIGASGAMTGFSAPGGAEAKRRLLKIEGALAPELFD